MVETIISIVLFTVIIIASGQYIIVSRGQLADATHSLRAWQVIANRFEYGLNMDYELLSDSLVEFGTLIAWNGQTLYRTTAVTDVDDPLDGLSPVDTSLPDYLKVMVTISQNTPDNPTDSSYIYFTPQRNR
ncbi:MAG: hypothetical protein HQ509_03505 [Candidatus Marinimicrobia bacterium]|nr:hypothetical protein [Candidatus Neomarinimicrobiota bacterium]